MKLANCDAPVWTQGDYPKYFRHRMKKNHQALAVKEKHYETKWWEYSGGKTPTLNSATARKNWRVKHCQILWSWMGWARGNTKNLFIYYIPHTMNCHKFLNHSGGKKKITASFFFLILFQNSNKWSEKNFMRSCSQPLELIPSYSGAFTSRATLPLCKWILTWAELLHTNQQTQKSEWVV